MGLGRIGEALLTPPAAALALAPLPNPAVRSGSRLGGAALLQAAPVESQTAPQMAWGSWALSLAELSWAVLVQCPHNKTGKSKSKTVPWARVLGFRHGKVFLLWEPPGTGRFALLDFESEEISA